MDLIERYVSEAAMRLLLWAGVVVAVSAALLYTVYIPWAMTWGATDEEVGRQMPGDEVVPHPTFNATRAVTIRGRPEEVWPWIVQIGYRRAGFYSWDSLDNDGIPSSDRILAQYQEIAIGDAIPLSRSAAARVVGLEPNRSLLLVVESDHHRPWTWAYALHRVDNEHTRLVTRLRASADGWWLNLFLETLEIVMMREHMLGIKRRVETSS